MQVHEAPLIEAFRMELRLLLVYYQHNARHIRIKRSESQNFHQYSKNAIIVINIANERCVYYK